MTEILPVSKLLARIGLDKLPNPDSAGLFEFADAFRRAIAFENLDTLAGIPVATNLDRIVEKIIINGRGGWCYELNQLLGETLRVTGFKVKYRMARVGYLRPGLGPLTHLLLFVELDAQEWLVDVGFGGPGPTEPLMISAGESTGSEGERFRISRGMQGDLTLHRWIGNEWARLYQVEPIDILAIDIDMANHFTSTWPQSPFRRMFMCVAYDGKTNWMIEGDQLVQRDVHWALVSRSPIEGPHHLQSVLDRYFGIQASEMLVKTSWERAIQGQ